jgi:hypothetical protein
METRTPHTGGRPVQGEASNRTNCTTSWLHSQAAERPNLTLLVIACRVGKGVVA